MARIEQDAIKGLLQALEHMLDTVDRTSIPAGQLVNAQKTGKPLSPATLKHYEEQLKGLDRQRAQMRDIIGRWWTLVEDKQ